MYSGIHLLKMSRIQTNLPQQMFPSKASAHPKPLLFFLLLSMFFIFSLSPEGHARDFLTDKEIELLQNTQSVANRARIYMDAAALRLKTAKDKLSNKEYEAGDPMELLMPEEVIGAYCKILQSVHLIVGYAIETPERRGNESVAKALKTLQEETEKALKELAVLQRMAEEKQRDPISDSLNEAIDITNDILDDASEKLARLRSTPPNNK
jgi:hypothetical protein